MRNYGLLRGFGLMALLADFAFFGSRLAAFVVAFLSSFHSGFTAGFLVIGRTNGRDTHQGERANRDGQGQYSN